MIFATAPLPRRPMTCTWCLAQPDGRAEHRGQQAPDLLSTWNGAASPTRRRRRCWRRLSWTAIATIWSRPAFYRPHCLSEPEEKILDEKRPHRRAAFVRLFDESVAADSLSDAAQREDGEVADAADPVNKLYDPDRAVRKAAAKALTKGLQENARLLTYIFNTLVLDHRSDCDLRHFPTAMAPRHLGQRDHDASCRGADDGGREALSAGAALLPAQGRSCWASRRCTTTTATRRCSPTCRSATGRRRGRSSSESYEAFSPKAGGDHPRVLRQALDRRRAARRASAAGRSAAAPCPASIRTS